MVSFSLLFLYFSKLQQHCLQQIDWINPPYLFPFLPSLKSTSSLLAILPPLHSWSGWSRERKSRGVFSFKILDLHLRPEFSSKTWPFAQVMNQFASCEAIYEGSISNAQTFWEMTACALLLISGAVIIIVHALRVCVHDITSQINVFFAERWTWAADLPSFELKHYPLDHDAPHF